VNTAEEHWDALVGQFRQLCLLRRQKKFIESDIILTSELPRAIAEWSQVSDGEPVAKKSRLDAMFQNEQRRIDDACFAMELLTDRLKTEILPAVTSELTEQIRATVMENIRAAISEDIRNIVATELRKSVPTHTEAVPESDSSESVESTQSMVPSKNLLSNFAQQVRSSVAQKAYVAVLEELAREKKPAQVKAIRPGQKVEAPQKVSPQVPPRPKSPAAAAPGRLARPAVADVSAVIDFVLAEEQQTLKNKYKFELSACP
jgi:hypothetical protein